MKSITYIAILILLTMTLSCKKNLLDSSPQDKYTDAALWRDSTLANLYLNNIYSGIPSEYDQNLDMLANYTDECVNQRVTASSYVFGQNLANASSSPMNSVWARSYSYIRQCNVLLANIDNLPASGGLKTRMIGQAKFLRALYYHTLYNIFGRFSIVRESLSLGDNLFLPRATNADCINFMAADLSDAAAVLPTRYTVTTDIGRVTKGAALALLSRIYLYDGQWQKSSDASKAVIDLGVYSLFPDYAGIFYPQNDNNSEVIFDKQYLPLLSDLQYHQMDYYNLPPNFTGTGSSTQDPSGNLVDRYEMKDGSNFSWDNPVHAANPYANRDPRLDASIMHDKSVWLGKTMDMKIGTVYNPSSRPAITGYYLKKFLSPTYDVSNSTSYSGQNFVYLRYAEILLNYAEAQLKLGNTEVARDYVNRVRARTSVAMPAILAADFNETRYRKERSIELAFEGTRLWDINRWRIGPETRGTDITGVSITDVGTLRTYKNIVAQKGGIIRIFQDKMYLFPIPQAEIDKYPTSSPLEQNTGWQ